MQFKRWVVNPIDKPLALELAEECNIDPFVALIASGRGYTDPAELDEFLSDELILADPYELSDIEKAAEIINESVYSEEKIAVFGDYDVDGVTATALMYSYLKKRGANVLYFIPDREKDGYGINIQAIETLKNQGVNLIITVDNGISAIDEVRYAKSLGIKVVVTDHHLAGDIIPEADAVVDPHKPGDTSYFKDICGVFVAFKVLCVTEGKSPEELIADYADLVALGTVADVMPLVNENRTVVREGVKLISMGNRLGLSALCRSAGLERDQLSASRLAFGLAPRINAAGRMGDAARAAELLLTEDEETAEGLASLLNNENIKRQSIEKQIFTEAVKVVEKNGYKHNRVIVVSGEGWHGGIVGIVASRLAEKYGRPAIVLSTQNSVANGSARSISGFSIYEALSACSYLLTKFGGHEMAAGLTLYEDSIDLFRKEINSYAEGYKKLLPELKLDCKLNPAALSVDLAEEIKALEPFGVGNPVPLFGVFGLTIQRISPVGSGKHLRIEFSKDNATFSAMLFGTTKNAFAFDIGDKVDIAITIDTNFFGGNKSLTISVKDIKNSAVSEDKLLDEINLYELFKSGHSGDFSYIIPSREEVGKVYKLLLLNPCCIDKLITKNLTDIGYAKTLISAEALCELGICSRFDIEGVINLQVTNSQTKTNLQDAKILKKLRGEI